jgi:putative ABC transport system permease protein
MIRNVLLIAFRNLIKHKTYSFIKIAGLAIGLASFIMIMLYVRFELSYDKYHSKADRIYRVSRQWFDEKGASSLHLGHVAAPFGVHLRMQFSDDIEKVARFLRNDPLIRCDDKVFQEDRFFFAEQDAFDIFSYEVIHGDTRSALAEPNTLVMTESSAMRYFGTTDVVGKTVQYEDNGVTDFKISAVIRDVPANSHFHFDMLGSFKSVEAFFGVDQLMRNFGGNNYSTYVLLKEGAEVQNIKRRVPELIDRVMPPHPHQKGKASQSTTLNFWRLADIHLHSNLDSEIEPNSRIELVYAYTLIAVFILLIACINFVNLFTARSADRAKEVGLRKVVGADRAGLIRQFLGETLFVAIASLGVAVLLVEAGLPYFNAFVAKPLVLNWMSNPLELGALILLVLVVGVAAGLYPAFYLSAFRPAVVLKGEYKTQGRGERFRAILVVAQFTITIALIASLTIVKDQLDYVNRKDLGFSKENLIRLPIDPSMLQRYSVIRQELLEHPGIRDVSMSSRVPSGRLLDASGGKYEIDEEMKELPVRIADIHVDHRYFQTFGIPMIAGRDFDASMATDTLESFVVNEATVKALGWPDAASAVGKRFEYSSNRKGRIIGVVKDFHFENLHQPISPMVFVLTTGRVFSLTIRISDRDRDGVLAYVNQKWNEWRPGYPFAYSFIDDNYRHQYQDEEKLATIIGAFAVLAIVVACLGIFGLAMFTTRKRTKEIGIRKVMGASVTSILRLLSSQFARYVVVAAVVAAPVAYYAMDRWLSGFAYHTDIGWWVFVQAGLMALIIAVGTVAVQSYKAAVSDPVKAIRYE